MMMMKMKKKSEKCFLTLLKCSGYKKKNKKKKLNLDEILR